MIRGLAALVVLALVSAPSPSPSPSPSSQGQDAQYRSYVRMLTVDGVGLTASVVQLRSCNEGRGQCRQALRAARDQVKSFESDLDQTPPPACLSGTDSQIRAALGLYESGLDLVDEGSASQDRLKVVEGGILLAVATWKLAAAVREVRRSNC